MIRPTIEADIQDLFVCAVRFLSEAYGEIPKLESFEAMVHQLMMPEHGRCYTVEQKGKVVGAAGVLFYPCWHDTSKRDAQEIFWWINPENRGGRDAIRLIDQIEQDAMAAGINRLMLAHTAENEKVGFYYARRGYTKTETTYARRLSCQPE